MHDLVVFSHPRWDVVYQRPHELLSWLSRNRRVFFVEEPLHAPGPRLHETKRSRHHNVHCFPSAVDVVRRYGDPIRVARDTQGFIDLCRAALAEDTAQRAMRIGAGRAAAPAGARAAGMHTH